VSWRFDIAASTLAAPISGVTEAVEYARNRKKHHEFLNAR
jgi:hypothetical protein